ncbi:hypothetical protein F5141DRAFT_1011787, partial [Pisolithus sp. B1]
RTTVLFDTSGFDDTFVSDTPILGRIAHYYTKDIKLTSILYFHPISDNRVLDTSSRVLRVLRELCGKENLVSVVFVTTMRGEVSEEVGSARGQELQSDFWRAMNSLASTTQRFQGTTESPWKIIDSLPVSLPAERRSLQIRREMVDEYLPLYRTAAGRTLVESPTSPMSGSNGDFQVV